MILHWLVAFNLCIAWGVVCTSQEVVDVLFYNRIPKCGSTSMTGIFRKNSALLQYKVYDMAMNMYHADDGKLMQWMDTICRDPSRAVFINHMLFPSDAIRQRLKDCGRQVAFINVVREPFARMRSSYNAGRWGRRPAHLAAQARSECISSFERCVSEGHQCCSGQNLMTEYLSGVPLRNYSDAYRALANVDNHYVVIGVTEKLHETLLVLKHFFPQFFSDLAVPNLNMGPDNVTEPIESKRRVMFDAAYAYDTALYTLMVDRLQHQFDACVPNK